MHKIELNANEEGLSLGYRMLKKNLVDSGIFRVNYKDFPVVLDKYRRRKDEGFCFLRINNKLIIIDANGGHGNIEAMYRDGLFNEPWYKDVVCLVKTQYHPHLFYEEFQRKTGIKVVSWIMWPTDNFPLGCFKWNVDKVHKYTASCAGGRNSNRRWGRPSYIKYCERHEGFHTERLPVEKFVEVLKECRWGLILRGGYKGNCDAKNTREHEYMSCGMPLVLNYTPHYDYPFRPYEHFAFVKSPEELASLNGKNIRAFAKASTDIWNKYIKPDSSAKFLLKLLP